MTSITDRDVPLEAIAHIVRAGLRERSLYDALLLALNLLSGGISLVLCLREEKLIIFFLHSGSPTKVKEEIQRKTAGKSQVCGKIWQHGDMAYRCRNCGYDEPWFVF